MKKLILDLCGGSGSWSRPYKLNSEEYEVRTITLPEYDVRTYDPPERVYGILAAPPCTGFSFTGKKDRSNEDVLEACLRIIEKCSHVIQFWALENPVGLMIGVLRKYFGLEPKMKFQPYQYGDGWQKYTAIWGDFNVPPFTHKIGDVPPNPLLWYNRGSAGGTRRDKMPSLVGSHAAKIIQLPGLEWAKDYVYSFKSAYHERDAAARALTPPGFAQAFYEANR